MRVVLAIAGPWPALRGSQVLVRHLAEGLAARGHTVDVVGYPPGYGRRPGLHATRALLDAWLVLRLAAHVLRVRPALIHAHNYEAALAALVARRLSGCPVVYHGHCAMATELPSYVSGRIARRLLGSIGRILDRAVPRQADFCIVVSEELRRELEGHGVPRGRLVCIPPVGFPREVDGAVPPECVVDDRLVCYAGNLDGYQNLDFLLASFVLIRQAVPGARLALVTHGDARQGARALERRGLGPGVEIVVARSYEEVRMHLVRAAVLVSPRMERSGFPMKLLNYMAAGKPIVACAACAKGLVNGKTARIVPDGSPEAFAGAVIQLLENAEERRRLGTAARVAIAEPGRWDAALDRVESIYRRVAARPPRPLPAAVTEHAS